MPVKKTYRKAKATAKAKPKYAVKKKAYTSRYKHDKMMLTYMPNNHQAVLPPRYKTRLIASAYGATTSGAGSGDYQWKFPLNFPYLPFYVSAGSGISGLTLNNITISTYQCPGFSQLCNVNFYTQYRCLASRIEIEGIPQSVADSMTYAITPSQNLTSPSTVAGALAQPFTKSVTFMSGRGKQKLVNYCTVHDLKGVRRQAIEDDLSGNYIAGYNGVPNSPCYWQVNLETPDNAVLSLGQEITIKITYYVEFFGLTTYQPQI